MQVYGEGEVFVQGDMVFSEQGLGIGFVGWVDVVIVVLCYWYCVDGVVVCQCFVFLLVVYVQMMFDVLFEVG